MIENMEMNKIGKNIEESLIAADFKVLKNGNKTENGKKMFIFQAQASFKIWNNLEPKVDDKVMELLN